MTSTDDTARLLIILRGISGSGKSYLSAQIMRDSYDIEEPQWPDHIFSSDNYFINAKTGDYEFNSARLGRAHEWNQRRVESAMKRGVHPIVVDNTNTQYWEMKPYVEYALQHGYQVEFREPDTPWKFDAVELSKRNLHSVPMEATQRMLDRWERDPTVEKILQAKVPRRNRPRGRGRGRGGGGRGRGEGSDGRGRGGNAVQTPN